MEAQNRKKIWLTAAAALLAGGAFLYAGEEIPVPLTSETEQVLPKHEERQEIAGWQKAEETEAVRNPFSLLHETAGEEQTVAGKSEKVPGKVLLTAQAPVSPLPRRTDYSTDVQSIPELKGVMKGENGKIVMVQIAGQTASLSVGESFQNCTILAIEEISIVISHEGQERRLFLPGY